MKEKSFYNSLQFKIHLWMQFILITFLILGYIVYISQLNFYR